jgi:hypothetical protein
MTAVSDTPSVSGVAAGMADADRVGVSARAQAASPINKSLFMKACPPLSSRDRDKVQSYGRSQSSLFQIGDYAFQIGPAEELARARIA